MKFDYRHPVLMISQWFTRFNHISCRGGSIAIYNEQLFKELKGFDENFVIYEDNEIISRHAKFVVIPDYIITSARRYHQNGFGVYNTISVSFILNED
jgi:predicted glycosyltransferase involved in capsule biosynthesis